MCTEENELELELGMGYSGADGSYVAAAVTQKIVGKRSIGGVVLVVPTRFLGPSTSGGGLEFGGG